MFRDTQFDHQSEPTQGATTRPAPVGRKLSHRNHFRTSSRRKTCRGFTLVEILVVVSIIALLAGMVSLRLLGVVGSTKAQIAESDAGSLATALKLYLLDTGVSPEDGMDLTVLLLSPSEGGGRSGPYLEKRDAHLDPWGNPFVVVVPGEKNVDYDIVSYGSDGQPGGEGDAADITH